MSSHANFHTLRNDSYSFNKKKKKKKKKKKNNNNKKIKKFICAFKDNLNWKLKCDFEQNST